MADCEAAKVLLEHLPPMPGYRSYDTNPSGRASRPTAPAQHPAEVRKSCFSPMLYRARNAIGRMFCRLKDFRRIATRYDRLATNFLAAIHIAAAVSYLLRHP
ncbi:transposase (plasmid) [Sinorhizobium americanum CCGM7]|nr:transposase [Sinorhizobium americanum CCGM7]